MKIHDDINDVKPAALEEMVGQRGVLAQVRVALAAAKTDRSKFDHSLLVGPPGLGKSQTARIIAESMRTKFKEVLGQSINCVSDLNALLLEANDRDVIHFDEAHELGKEFQTTLYLALDQKQILLQGRNGPQSLPIADFTLLLSTTDEYGLLQPLRDRCRLLLRFDYFSPKELAEIVRRRSSSLDWRLDKRVPEEIALRARGVPRLALRLLQSCRRVCRAYAKNTITLAHLEEACTLEAIDPLGLGATERKYLNLLSNGPTRLNVLAAMLGLPTRTISEVIEPFLLRVHGGLIAKDDQGRRQLTPLGRDHVSHHCQLAD